jgi:prepilin signal peptidase PulO-like enzyme (type II secretory pathway)
VPVLGWIWLRGRCRQCKTRISLRYPLVEILTGCLFLLAWTQHGDHRPTGVLVSLALASFVAISFIDLDHRIIPDKITKPGMLLAVAAAPFSRLFTDRCPAGFLPIEVPHAVDALAWSVGGLIVGGGVILIVRAVGSWFLGKEAMGLGDMKLLALAGALLGPIDSVYVLVLGCLAGAVIGGVAFAIGRRRAMGCAVRALVGDAAAGGQEVSFDRAQVRDGRVRLPGGPSAADGAPEPGRQLRLEMLLPSMRILEDEDALVSVKGALESVDEDGTWHVRLAAPGKGKAAQLAHERLDFFAQSYRYIPFGPFLCVGATAMLLYGSAVTWFIRVGYPDWVRSLTG